MTTRAGKRPAQETAKNEGRDLSEHARFADRPARPGAELDFIELFPFEVSNILAVETHPHRLDLKAVHCGPPKLLSPRSYSPIAVGAHCAAAAVVAGFYRAGRLTGKHSVVRAQPVAMCIVGRRIGGLATSCRGRDGCRVRSAPD